MSKRQFLFQDGKSDKFWDIEVSGAEYSVNFGRTGTGGQSQTKTFPSPEAAQAAADKLIAEKIRKGYVEASGNTEKTSPAATVSTSSAPRTSTAPTEIAPTEIAPTAATSTPAGPNSPPAFSPGLSPSADTNTEMAVAPESSASPAINGRTVTASLTDSIGPAAVKSLPPAGEVPERALKLAPEDWLWATWRPRVPQPKPTPQPFDKERALEKLQKVMSATYGWDWRKANLKAPYSPQEAHFWITAHLSSPGFIYNTSKLKAKGIEIYQKLESTDFDGRISREEVIRGASRSIGVIMPPVDLLVALFPPIQAMELVLELEALERQKNAYSSFNSMLGEPFRAGVLPYLSERELQEIKDFLRPKLKAESRWLSLSVVPGVLTLSAVFGLSDELEPIVAGLDDTYSDNNSYNISNSRPQEVVLGLRSAESVNRHMRRLGLPLTRAEYITAWLAHTEFEQLDYIGDSIIQAEPIGYGYGTSVKDIADAMVKAFATIEAPEVAPQMLRIMTESKGPRFARQWLEEHPLHGIHGLLSLALGRGKMADIALQQLKTYQRRGFESHLRAAANSLPEAEQGRLEEEVFQSNEKQYEPFSDADLPQSVREALLSDKKLARQRTSWVKSVDLPPITYGDARLGDSHIEVLLTALRSEGHALTKAVKATADTASLDTFAWQLFQLWLSEGAPSKEKWAMLALGELGGDKCALQLTPLVRAWPGESQHQRAVTGLECLRRIGTDTALMQLNGIAQRVKFKGLQSKAIEAMEAIAADRGLSRAQLEDRVIPDCGLDERGSRILDFGPRQFRFVLGPDMKPMVREEGAKLVKPRPTLPAPNSKDDADKAENAQAEWKLLKKQIVEVTKIQAVRLEQAMVKGRRWTLEEFESLLVHHPLMTHLVRLLVWEAAAGNRRATFRVTEDNTYADSSDELFDLAGGEWAHVGIAHPMNIPDAEKRAWGELFADYEIVPPFPQIGRPIYSLEGDEVSAQIITRFNEQKVQPQTLCFTLEKLDWERGPALDSGGFYEHYKYFESSDVTACAVYEPGLFMGGQEYWEPQQVMSIYFVNGWRSKRNGGYWQYPDEKQAIALSEADAIAISEVLKDITEIVAKGEVK